MLRTPSALPRAVVLALIVGASGGAPGSLPRAAAAAVVWPTSTLVVSEVQTGGASASDEFVEIANQGAVAVDLLGMEVVYATSSGSTVTRKATWSTSLILEASHRILLANGAGTLASVGDAVYTGGFAAAGGGGARPVGGGVGGGKGRRGGGGHKLRGRG